MTEEVEDLSNYIRAAADEYEADLYFYSGPIDNGGFGQITEEITRGKSREKALLILVTNGGLANSAYQIARLFQSQYKEFIIFCPSRCKSAGTLVALGANRLIMDVFGELGPLDVQLIKQDEIFSRKSGLLAKSSFDALGDSAFELYEKLMISITLKSSGNVSFKVASELAASMAATMFAPVYAQINPEVVGSENRDLSIAFEYGIRLIDASKNASLESVYKLVSEYPSHDFIIDNVEARQLFKRVDEPSEALYRIIGAIGDAAYDEASTPIACVLTGAPHGANENDEDSAGAGRMSANVAPKQHDVDDSRPRDRSGDSEAPIEDGHGDAPVAEFRRTGATGISKDSGQIARLRRLSRSK